MKAKHFIYLLLFAILGACDTSTPNEKPKKKIVDEQKKPALTAPQFNADSAYSYIDKQVAFGPRVPETPQHAACADYLVNRMKSFGWDVQTQEGMGTIYTGRQIKIKNIIASYKPEEKNRLLLFAHWDTRPFADNDNERIDEPILGASDGASGVGVLMEIARQVNTAAPYMGIDIIFFDAEDWGKGDDKSYCLGSQYWAKTPHKKDYHARYGILLDMVGAKNATFLKEGYSMQNAQGVVQKIWSKANGLGYVNYFMNQTGGYITDDHVFVMRGTSIPCADIIHQEMYGTGTFGHYWHTHDDNMSIIDKNTLKAVGQTLLEVIYSEQ